MRDLVRLIVWMVADLFRSRAALEAEIWTLRQQISVLRRTAPKKQTFSSIDRLIFVCLYRLLPGIRDALAITAAPACPLLRGERTKLRRDPTSVFDPGCVKTQGFMVWQ